MQGQSKNKEVYLYEENTRNQKAFAEVEITIS